MRKAIAIGMLGLALVSNRAAAQTAVERAQILRDFENSVADYTQQHERPVMFPGASAACSPAAKVFTLPVAMVFRQVIAETVMEHHSVAPSVISGALPPLPAALHYRFNGNDLELWNAEDDTVVAVLKEAFSAVAARR